MMNHHWAWFSDGTRVNAKNWGELCRFFILDQNGEPVGPVDGGVWATWMAAAKRTIARDEVFEGRIVVSTIFTGYDEGWHTQGVRLFETMVFGGPLHMARQPYGLRSEALLGHAKWIGKVKRAGDHPPQFIDVVAEAEALSRPPALEDGTRWRQRRRKVDLGDV